jgi:hypothetical protein
MRSKCYTSVVYCLPKRLIKLLATMQNPARIFLIAVLLCSLLPARAQEEFVPPPSRFVTSFPFRMLTGGIITLKAKVGDFKDTLTFILDTGSGGISLDSMTTEKLQIKTEMSDRTIRGIAGIRQVRFAYNMKLHLPRLTVDSLNFHINDYEVLTSSYGEKIDGIIGFSFLSRYIVKVDYDSSKIYVYTRGTFKYPRGGFLIRPLLINLPVVSIPVKDEREVFNRYYFDTGAGMCLLLSSDFVKDSAFIKTKRKWYATQAEGLGGKAPMKQGIVKQVRIGPYRFRNVPTYIFDDEFNVTSYPYLGGLLGNDLLRRFNLILNYDRRDIYLIPNSHFRDPFDYSYTGLGMYVIDGEIRIIDVMPGSPAEEAGFKPGDIVMAVENNFTNNIQAYKTLLQTPGGKLKVLVLREDGPTLLTLKVKNIMK